MLKNYITVALKVLGRRKFFTFISLFGISLTLVVLMVAATLLDNSFEPRPPESRFDRALGVYQIMLKGPESTMNTQPGYDFLNRYVRNLPGAEHTSLFTTPGRVALYLRGQKIETHIRRTDGAYWNILDFTFVEGSPYAEDDNANARFVAVITTDVRKQVFGNTTAVGKTIDVDGQRYRVVGVVEPVAITRRAGFSGIWAPLRTAKSNAWEKQTVGEFQAVVLAKDRADLPKLRAAFQDRLDRYVFEDKRFNIIKAGLDTPFESQARDMFGDDFGEYRGTALRALLFTVALLFITLPTLNLVSINLSRIMERASEIGVRKAFGASSRSLVGQFVIENIVLTVIGGLIAFLLTIVAIQGMNRLDIIPYAVFDVNLRLFFYALGIAALFGAISGVYPAWRMSRMHPVNALRGGVR